MQTEQKAIDKSQKQMQKLLLLITIEFAGSLERQAIFINNLNNNNNNGKSNNIK